MKSLHELAAENQMRGASDFARAALCLLKGGGLQEAEAIAGRHYGPRLREVFTKAAVSGATLSSAEGGSFYESSRAFVASLSSSGAFDAMLSSAVSRPLEAPAISVSALVPTGSSGLAEGSWRPISSIAVGPAALTRSIAMAIVVATREALELGAPGLVDLIARELRAGLLAALDNEFLGALATAAAVTVPAGGSMPGAVNAALDLMDTDASARLFLIGTPDVVRRLALAENADGVRTNPELNVNGGSLAGIRVIASDAFVTAGSPATPAALLVDASQIALADGGITMSTASHASLKMDDAPSPGAGNLVSLWQTNSTGLRVVRPFGYAVLRPTAVAAIDNAGGW